MLKQLLQNGLKFREVLLSKVCDGLDYFDRHAVWIFLEQLLTLL